MPRFRIRFYQEDSGFIYFEATSILQARALLEQLQDGDIDKDDLPDMGISWKNGSSEFADLEEV